MMAIFKVCNKCRSRAYHYCSINDRTYRIQANEYPTRRRRMKEKRMLIISTMRRMGWRRLANDICQAFCAQPRRTISQSFYKYNNVRGNAPQPYMNYESKWLLLWFKLAGSPSISICIRECFQYALIATVCNVLLAYVKWGVCVCNAMLGANMILSIEINNRTVFVIIFHDYFRILSIQMHGNG